MKLPRHELAAALARRSLATKKPKELAAEIAAFLLHERRVGELDSIMRDVMQYRADNGIVEVVAASAFPLSPATRGDIEAEIKRAYPAAKEVVISPRLDESVVAGVRLTLANQQLDLSIRNKLNKLKQLTAAGKEN